MSPKLSDSDSTSIPDVRAQIDNVDTQLLALLAARQTLSAQVIQLKDAQGVPTRNQDRERDLLKERIKDGRELGLEPQFVTKVFHEVIAASIRAQQDILQQKLNGISPMSAGLRVAFQGIDGSYSHLLGKAFLKHSDGAATKALHAATLPSFVGFPSFEDAVKAVEQGTCDYAVLPIENTTSGGINDVYDLLLNSRVSIIGEEKFNVRHCLVGHGGIPVTHLQKILCSPLAVAECRRFLSQLPDCRIEYCSDSALAVKQVKEAGDKCVAAIASEEAAEMFELKVLQRGIANQDDNFTRYIVVAQTPQKVDGRIPAKTSIVINTLHQPGALVDALQVFRENKINLTKLESRPVPGNSWEEMFYVDFIGNLESTEIKTVLGELTKLVRFIKVLGCYPVCDVEPTNVSHEHSEAPRHITIVDNTVPEIKETPKDALKPAGKDKGYKLVTREHKPDNTVIDIGGIKIGDGNFLVIAGPCSVESREQIMSCAKEARDNGARILRGGVFKPRTSPYSFQGLGYEGLDLLVEAGRAFGMPVITEVMTTDDVERVAEKADIIQIGARNMQNFSLLKVVGQSRRPVMLKRGLSCSIEELLQATEYILAGGNQQVFLCERGIRTFETATRGTLDISAVPVLKSRTHLPIFIDPSHAAGVRELVPPLALAAKAVGADGIIVEFHPEPEKALSDGPQALRYPQFEKLMTDLRRMPNCIE
jgi:chorismate mutase/prephenate dehydratase